MSKKAVLIGGTGFVGHHLNDLFLKNSIQSFQYGIDKDIRNKKVINELLSDINPDFVVNLAALTTVKETIENPSDTYEIGFIGTRNILDQLQNLKFKGTYLNVSSSEVYGHPDENELPLNEESALQPMSPYAVNKIATEALCYQYSQNANFKIVTARPFTHIGPGQTDRFAISAFGKQVAEIERGIKDPVIYVGNLNTTRDLTDVRDIVKAYLEIIKNGVSGEIYNVCSNNEVSIDFVLKKMMEFSSKKIEITFDKNLLRSKEQARIKGCNKKLSVISNWKVRIKIEDTLNDIYNHWLSILRD